MEHVFGSSAGEHYRAGWASVEPDGRRAKTSGASFVLFGGGPISRGVFRCTIAFGASSKSDLQHVGVLPAGAAGAAVEAAYGISGFSHDKIRGWGCRQKDASAVAAGVAEDHGHSVALSGRTVELVLDAEARTLVIGNPGGAEIRFDNVCFPVVPAILLSFNEATLTSCSHDVRTLETPRVLESRRASTLETPRAPESRRASTLETPRAPESRRASTGVLETSTSGKVNALEKLISGRNQMFLGQEQKVSAMIAEYDDRLGKVEQTMHAKVMELEQKILDQDHKVAALEQRIADDNEKIRDLTGGQSEKASLIKNSISWGEVLVLQKSVAELEGAIQTLEARVFSQGPEELFIAKALAAREATVQRNKDNLSALRVLVANGESGLGGRIATGTSELEEAEEQVRELRSKLVVVSEKKAHAKATMGEGFIPLEQDIALKLKEFKNEVLVLASMQSTVKQRIGSRPSAAGPSGIM